MRAHLAGDELHVDGVGRLGAELGQQRGGEQQQAADWARCYQDTTNTAVVFSAVNH